jgi:4-amino-4-deoxy-L-arabinose transferase-like glycosyltransferase
VGQGLPDQTTSSEAATPLAARRHIVRVVGLMVVASMAFGWLAARADIFFADGLRYIGQAKQFASGSWSGVLRRGIDHPVYPMLVSAVHGLFRLGETPEAWQRAAQGASVAAAVLLIIPLYLLARELFGDRLALPSCLLACLVPLSGHVFADTLSESTFLLFWTTGLWASLRFLRLGQLRWVPLIVVASGLAYLTRPEGLLLPAALLTTIALCPRWVFAGLGRRGVTVLAVLVVGSACLIGPYVVLKGGLGTKPSIARLLGTAPKSAAHAVERQRPLDPDQSAAKTYILAGRAAFKAVMESITWPLVPFFCLGLAMLRPRDGASRQWRLIGVIGVASMLALIRLHATGGYCTPRHAMILMLVAIPTAAFGFVSLLDRLTGARRVLNRVGWTAALVLLALVQRGDLLSPVNAGLGGYREAGRWLSAHPGDAGRVVDVTGWSQYYGNREGYTFENLIAAPSDGSARWVVAREAHLKGPWEYCQRLRALVDGLQPVAEFRGTSGGARPTRVYLYDRQPLLAGRPDALRR